MEYQLSSAATSASLHSFLNNQGHALLCLSLGLSKENIDQILILQQAEVRPHISACGLGGKLGPVELYTGTFNNAKSWDHHSCCRRCRKVMSPAFSALSEKGLGEICPLLQAALSPQKYLRRFLRELLNMGECHPELQTIGVTGGRRKSPFIQVQILIYGWGKWRVKMH